MSFIEDLKLAASKIFAKKFENGALLFSKKGFTGPEYYYLKNKNDKNPIKLDHCLLESKSNYGAVYKNMKDHKLYMIKPNGELLLISEKVSESSFVGDKSGRFILYNRSNYELEGYWHLFDLKEVTDKKTLAHRNPEPDGMDTTGNINYRNINGTEFVEFVNRNNVHKEGYLIKLPSGETLIGNDIKMYTNNLTLADEIKSRNQGNSGIQRF